MVWERRAARGILNLEPFLADQDIVGERRRRPLEHDAAMTHDIETSGDLEGNSELLFNQQDRRAAARNLVEQRADLFGELGSESFGRLVDDD